MNIDADSNIVIAGIAKVRDEEPEENQNEDESEQS